MNIDQLKNTLGNVHHPLLISFSYHKDKIFQVILKGKDRNWEVDFTFNDVFPFSLPKVKLLEDDYIGRIPHVNIKGILCIDESDSIIVNYRVPEDIICYVIETAVRLLDRGLLKINRGELTDEYEGYFDHISGHIPGIITKTDLPHKIYIKLWFPKNGKKFNGEPIFINSDGSQLSDKFSNFAKTKSFQIIKSIYIPIELPVLPPRGSKGVNAEYIYKLLSLIGQGHKKLISKISKKISPSNQFYILFGTPRSDSTKSLILFRLKSKKPKPHPIKEKSLDWDVRPYLINRHDKEYLLERGGADIVLSNTRVAIIGVGSVGSEIASLLAKAGVGNLTLIDHDILEIDNIYRHRVGGSGLNYKPDSKSGKVLGWTKASILSSYLESELPHIKVKAISKSVEEVLDGNELKDAEIIISAVGSPSLNLFLNQKFKSLNYKKIIYCWNEAKSAGGHAIGVNLDTSCFECQFWNSGEFSLTSPISIVKGGQHFTKNLTGCAGVFTPFSYLDSSQTALITARLCIEIIAGGSNNQIISWKNPNAFGLELTERYFDMDLIEKKSYQQSAYCKVCHNE